MAYAERELATTEFGGAEESPATHQIDKSLKYSVTSTNEVSLSLEYRIEPVTRPIDVRGGGELGTFEFGGAVAPKVLADIEKSLQYTVESTQTIDKALQYAIADTQTIDKSLQYAVADTKSIDKSLKYTVDTTQTIDKSLQYAIGETQTIDKSLKYAVEATKNIDKSLEYRVVLDSQTIDKSLQYNIRTIRIKINGTERRSEFSNDSLTVENNLFSEPDFATLSFIKSSTSSYTPSSGDEIEVYDNGTKIFGGLLIDIHREMRGKAEEYLLEFKDWIEELDNIIVAETYTNQTVNQIVSDINSNYLTGYDISNVNDSTNIDRVVFDNISVAEALDKLTDLSNHNWYVDPNKNIYVFADSDIQAPFDLSDNSGTYDWKTLQVSTDYTQIRNKVSIQGQNIPLVTVQDGTSQSNYGVREYVERDDQIVTTEEANQKANAILAAYKDPIYKAKFQTRKPSLYAGQEINIASAERGVSARDYVINKVVFRSDHPHHFRYDVKAKTQREVSLENFIQGQAKAPLNKTPIADQGFLSEISFSATNFETISWNSGDITLGDGTTYSITGDSLTLTGDHIIYLDPDSSETALQDSTNFADGIGSGKIPLAYASRQGVTTKNADIIPVAFGRQIQLDGSVHITDRSVIADQIATNTLTANEIAANTITAGEIQAGTITANEISASTITGNEISSATTITAGSGDNVGVLDGADSTWRIYAGDSTPADAPFRVNQSGDLFADSVTLEGKFRTAGSGFARLEITPKGETSLTENAIVFIDGSGEYGQIEPTSTANPPGTISISSDGSVNIGASQGIGLLSTVQASGNIETFGAAIGSVDLGDSGAEWRNLYLTNRVNIGGDDQPKVHHGYVNSGGTFGTPSPSGWSVSEPSTGRFVVTHNLGTTNYAVTATAVAGAGAGVPVCKISDRSSDSFEVTVFTSDTATTVSDDFMFDLNLT